MIETVRARQGAMQGIAGNGVSAFLGIPYAAPPVGDLRWREPQAAPTWEGTRAMDRLGPVAPQFLPAATSLYNPGNAPQSEDCLTLNVWTGAGHPGEKRAVIVWFHLGAFMFGSSGNTTSPDGKLLFDGGALARAGAVVVTVNYRLGRLGFLAHEWLSAESGRGASGNYGFMDQVAALEWVRDNIAEFGGDPGNVTIFGVSAGSASCSLHLASPLSRGLFHRTIAGSGGFMAPAAATSGIFDRMLTLEAAEKRGRLVSDALGVRDLAQLRAASVEAVMSAPIPYGSGDWYMDAVGMTCGEGASDTTYPIVDGFALPDAPAAILARGEHNDVPLITGSTLDDASGLPALDNVARFHAYLDADMSDLAAEARAAWPATDAATCRRASGDLLADRVFGWQNWTMARLAAANGTAPVYYYDWQHAPPIPTGRYAEQRLGAVHASDIPYAFRNLDGYDWRWTAQDRELQDTVSSWWLNFARTGNPNGEGLPDWPRFAGHDGQAMQITARPEAGPPSRQTRFALLDRYYGRAA